MLRSKLALLFSAVLIASAFSLTSLSTPASAAIQDLVFDCSSNAPITLTVSAGDSLHFNSNCNMGIIQVNDAVVIPSTSGNFSKYPIVDISGSLTPGTYNNVFEIYTATHTVYSIIVSAPSVSTPTITSISPSSGGFGDGTLITITGTDFAAGAAVTVGGVTCLNISVTPTTSISCNSPLIAAGVKDVVVTNTDSGTVTATGGFTVTAPISTPTITSISPNRGSTKGGTRVTITGTGFNNAASVTIGGTSATIISRNGSTGITVRTPAHAKGAVSVVVTNPDTGFVSFSSFTYVKDEDSRDRGSRERD